MTEESVFSYDGFVYVRPVSRGVVMLERKPELYVEEAVADGYYRMRISFEKLSSEEEHEAKGRWK